jgi:hypothetical protein
LFTCSWATAAPPTVTPGRAASSSAISPPASCHSLVVGRLQRGHQVGGVAVVGDEVTRAGGVEAADRLDVAAGAQLPFQRGDTSTRRGLSDGRVVDHDDHGGDAQAGVPQLLPGLDGLGGGVVGAVGVETLGDGAAQRAGDEEEGDCEEADAPWSAVGEAGE